MRNGPRSEEEYRAKAAMDRHHKQVFFADRIQERVRQHVLFARSRGRHEPLACPRLYVIYENVEANNPGDVADYSAVLDAPFYKLQVESSKESGYVKLKKLEILESTLNEGDNLETKPKLVLSDQSSDSDSLESYEPVNGQALIDQTKASSEKSTVNSIRSMKKVVEDNFQHGRRNSGPTKYVKSAVAKSNISNIHKFRKVNVALDELSEKSADESEERGQDSDPRHRKSILKSGNSKKSSVLNGEARYEVHFDFMQIDDKDNIMDDTETSGSRSTTSSRQNESSETDSDYGYSTITDLSTLKPMQRSMKSDLCSSTAVLDDECWKAVQVKVIDLDDDEEDENSSDLTQKALYETYFYLSSTSFMKQFVDNFITKLGTSLGLSSGAINNALTQGATIYCDAVENGMKLGCEVIPALFASWPDAADEWIIRKRKIIQNPRTNYSYQWLTKHMIDKTKNYGCLLTPLGYRAKRGLNAEQELQWKINFPAAEQYLESRLAHSQIRCYLFALALHKTFVENETVKLGIDSNHIKNHLFWECEDNYAKWPEDRLGEALRTFLKNFYKHLSKRHFPNYFVQSCDDFKGIPQPLLSKTQECLAEVLESPVMHMLNAVQKLKYTSKNFYPRFNYYKLYQILTCTNPLKMANPNLNVTPPSVVMKSDSDDDSSENASLNFGKVETGPDKELGWTRKKHRQSMEAKAAMRMQKEKATAASQKIIDKGIILPKKMESVRRRLVLEHFIPHFIEMARCSEKFEVTNQALIYLEHAQRLCKLLLLEPAGEIAAREHMDTIQEMIATLQRKLVHRSGYNLLTKPKAKAPPHLLTRQGSTNHTNGQDSSRDADSAAAFTFVQVDVGRRTGGSNTANIVLTKPSIPNIEEVSML
ncbi:hypothetical protein EVAR_5501_1 [Eumeta japonica]|uniref:Mab-21-like HhH/H2TH-like domain-containing protein n=1 Tax=Eumeta variegata TaxID=151549 RepID=A0A4C1TBX0_EUMVA|nr:hypothetical protein EVAR_5501_1 [Eumeta japonica]